MWFLLGFILGLLVGTTLAFASVLALLLLTSKAETLQVATSLTQRTIGNFLGWLRTKFQRGN